MPTLFACLRPLIHTLPPESAHNLALWLLRHGLYINKRKETSDALQVNVFGLQFTHPVGLAAGFDKNAVVINALLAQGFAFVEAGTVTPNAQAGNPRPRIFRLREDEAVINRLGFNNVGLNEFVGHFRMRNKSKGIAGANIGKNKDSIDAVADYTAGLRALYPHADYITVNISSPNTPGLRDLQHHMALSVLLNALNETREDCIQIHGHRVPLLLKVAPDLEEHEQADIVQLALLHHVDGLIISNTTIARPASLKQHTKQEGGLSGKPLFVPSTQALKSFYRLSQGKIPLIGVGGIASAQDAYEKIRAGATLVQLYTALVYQGIGLVSEIQKGLAEYLKRDGFTHIQQAVGVDVI